MSSQLVINDGTQTVTLTAPAGVSRLGGNPSCQLAYAHDEMPDVALSLDNSGKTLLVQNLTGYEIYVGDESLLANQTTVWQPGTELFLTEHISIELDHTDDETEETYVADADEVAKAKRQRQLVQIGVIAFCALIGLQQMSVDPAAASAKVQEFSFDEVRESLETQIEMLRSKGLVEPMDEWMRTLHALQEARFLEIRSQKRSPDQAITAYQRVLESGPVRDAPAEGDLLESQVFRYATAQKVILSER